MNYAQDGFHIERLCNTYKLNSFIPQYDQYSSVSYLICAVMNAQQWGSSSCFSFQSLHWW